MGFWFVFWLITMFFYMCCNTYISRTQYYRQNNIYKTKKIAVTIYGLIVIFFAGLRSGIGDTGYYMYGFEIHKNYDISDLLQGVSEKEPGYTALLMLISKFTKNPQIFLMIIAFITIGLILKRVSDSSEDVGLSIFLFYATGIYLGIMNGLRQYLVVAILFYMTDLIKKNKPVLYIICVLLLSTIHTSALFMIPVFFFARKKVWNLNTIVLLIVFVIVCVNFSTVIQNISGILDSTVYGNYSESLIYDTESGANLLRIVVMLVPVLLSFIGRKYVNVDDIDYRVYSNMLVLNAAFYCLAAYNWIFARIAMYLHIYMLLFYPFIINRLFNGKNKRFFKWMLIVFYTFFIFYEVRNTAYMSYYLNINRDLIGPLTGTFYK